MSNSKKNLDTRPEYWDEYTNLQFVKHRLISEYLKGWFPKLSWAQRIWYLDTHAGRGKHAGGQEGSPIVALRTLLEHSNRDMILGRSEVNFLFVERDDTNHGSLVTELQQLGELPKGIRVETVAGDAFDLLDHLIASVRSKGGQPDPAFIFVDPYGFRLPGSTLRRLMELPRVELFVNVLWRELNMALLKGDQPGFSATLDELFDSNRWQTAITSDDFDERAEQVVVLLRQMTRAKWATYVRMLGPNDATRYFLLHLTNHPAGRNLMKDCLWKVCPTGGFYARRRDDPSQELLITPDPNLNPLRQWVLHHLTKGPARWNALRDLLLEEIWREPHLTQVLRELRKDGIIDASNYKGRFGPKANPVLSINA